MWDLKDRLEAIKQADTFGILDEFEGYNQFIVGKVLKLDGDIFTIKVLASSLPNLEGIDIVVKNMGDVYTNDSVYVYINPVSYNKVKQMYEGCIKAKTSQLYKQELTDDGELLVDTELYITDIVDVYDGGQSVLVNHVVYNNFPYIHADFNEIPITRVQQTVIVGVDKPLTAGRYFGRHVVNTHTHSNYTLVYNY